MRIEIEEKDLDAITQKVVESLKPLMQNFNRPPETSLFDVKGLAAYLDVPKTWVYDHTKRREIPFMKINKYLRFRKSDIDKWLESKAYKPILGKK